MKRAAGLHPEAQARRSRLNARVLMGRAWYLKREAEIAALPRVMWKGVQLYTIRCDARSGRGPHLLNVPPSLLWQLVSIPDYLCPYHAGDAWASKETE
jgi:hypothetical protein